MFTSSDYVILLVEDSEEDYYATTRAFSKAGMANEIRRCEDGVEALDYLYHRHQYADPATSPKPNLILLDLNLPKKDGREVLKAIKSDKELSSIPVIILTTSAYDSDVDYCYHIGANSYMQKPVNIDKFVEAIQKLNDYWFKVVILPRDTR